MPFFSAFFDLITKKIGQFLLKKGSELIFKDMLGGTLIGTVGKATADKAIDEFMQIAMEKTLASYDEYIANLMKEKVKEKVDDVVEEEGSEWFDVMFPPKEPPIDVNPLPPKDIITEDVIEDIEDELGDILSRGGDSGDITDDDWLDDLGDLGDLGDSGDSDDLGDIEDIVTKDDGLSEENKDWVDLVMSTFTTLNEAQTDNPITQNNIDTIREMFEDSIEKNDTTEYVEQALEFYSNKVEAIILGLYNEETNTNRYGSGKDPERGRREFDDLINDLADILHIPAPIIFFS